MTWWVESREEEGNHQVFLKKLEGRHSLFTETKTEDWSQQLVGSLGGNRWVVRQIC